jgi:hypothetical protein
MYEHANSNIAPTIFDTFSITFFERASIAASGTLLSAGTKARIKACGQKHAMIPNVPRKTAPNPFKDS